jgi:hypothetical protein
MPETANVVDIYHVFVSSPGDMEREREAVRQFFSSLNQSIAQPFHIRFDVIDWENCANAGYQNPQDLITRQTLSRYRRSLALVVGLMGQRFGTPTGHFESGTQAEFEWAASHRRREGHPEIKWFFRRIDHFVAPAKNVRQIREAVEQWNKVQRFRSQYKGLYREFPDSASFPDVLREDLLRWFASWLVRKRQVGPGQVRAASLDSAPVPAFLDSPLSRTLRIVDALEGMACKPADYGEPCVRICAAMSSLAITEGSAWAKRGDGEYLQLILKERDLIEQLFEQKTSLKVLLTWSIQEMIEWEGRSREDVLARLRRLKGFCEKTLQDEGRIKRAQFVHIGIRERNLLILGKRYLFEGRKLGTRAGFEATEVITDKTRVAQEIELFDILFGNAISAGRDARKTRGLVGLNRRLLVSLVGRIDRDIAALAASLSPAGR